MRLENGPSPQWKLLKGGGIRGKFPQISVVIGFSQFLPRKGVELIFQSMCFAEAVLQSSPAFVNALNHN